QVHVWNEHDIPLHQNPGCFLCHRTVCRFTDNFRLNMGSILGGNLVFHGSWNQNITGRAQEFSRIFEKLSFAVPFEAFMLYQITLDILDVYSVKIPDPAIPLRY